MTVGSTRAAPAPRAIRQREPALPRQLGTRIRSRRQRYVRLADPEASALEALLVVDHRAGDVYLYTWRARSRRRLASGRLGAWLPAGNGSGPRGSGRARDGGEGGPRRRWQAVGSGLKLLVGGARDPLSPRPKARQRCGRRRFATLRLMTARRFGSAARVALFLAGRGCCAECGVALCPGWHADHVAPVRAGGATEPANGRALCPRCNLRKGGRGS